jgi:NAD+ synthase
VESAGAKGVVLGLSGGVDSAVAAALAARGLGRESVLALYLPCYSLEADRRDASIVAENLGVGLNEVSLDAAYDEVVRACGIAGAPRLTLANIKPRLRMTALYAFSAGRLVLGTGNYSEYLVGYSTKWGDAAADFLPLARLYKDEVRLLGHALGLPRGIVERIPSAGLWEGQSDEGEMGVSYSSIRACFEGKPVDAAESARILAMNRSSEHKRAPIPYFDARDWIATNA